MQENLNLKILKATKWSSISELFAKMISPLSSMILARVLTPTDFGVIATISVLISFSEMLADSGFQKYLIQFDFDSDDDKYSSANVAFWTNFIISIVILSFVIVFNKQLASLLGVAGNESAIVAACLVLPLNAMVSIQISLYKREFNFKILFYARMAGVMIPIVVSLPLALYTKNYWALIWGLIFKALVEACILTFFSNWKPQLKYGILKLKQMLGFCTWTFFEQFSLWISTYIDLFIVGTFFSSYYVGLYRVSMTTVTQFTTLITASITPVLFSALSRCQNDRSAFQNIFLKFQRATSIIIIPLSIGLFVYRDFVTNILLGAQWHEATLFIGLWGLSSGFAIILNNFSSEAYRALGMPKISFFVQLIHIFFLVPMLLCLPKYGFIVFVCGRCLIRLQMFVTQLLIVRIKVGVSVKSIMSNLFPSVLSGCLMGSVGMFLLSLSDNICWIVLTIAVSVLTYFLILFSVFKNIKEECFLYIKKIKYNNL